MFSCMNHIKISQTDHQLPYSRLLFLPPDNFCFSTSLPSTPISYILPLDYNSEKKTHHPFLSESGLFPLTRRSGDHLVKTNFSNLETPVVKHRK
jgi:hypothetical protein